MRCGHGAAAVAFGLSSLSPMRSIRRPLLIRLVAAGLLWGLGLGLLAPAATARERARAQQWALDALPSDLLAEVLKASDAATPIAIADALEAAFGARLPAVESLLDALYGQLLRVVQLEQGGRAVLVAGSAASSSGSAPSAMSDGILAEALSGAGTPATPTAASAVVHVHPRLERPGVQPLGP